ncbi:MAG: 2-C-methyl-D-erythritol 2,4-cyclodiphosphate synthase [Bacteroidales bacterium]
MKFRIGFGLDVHPLKENTDFRLGGISIPHNKGTVGYSDADTLIHAICDALLGAANLGDIGTHFPDTSPEFKGIDSKILLKKVVLLLHEYGCAIGNIDITICLQKPKVADYIPKMKITLAETMNISEDDISIKATTTEKMGFVGREEGIAVYAVALIEQI